MSGAEIARDAAFSYQCNGCQRCCHYRVPIGPYDIARLARNQGIAAAEFLTRFTQAAGTVLRRDDEDACVFLGPQGCTVYPDRPLACRLYPLKYLYQPRDAEKERFEPQRLDPRSRGVFGSGATVAQFLETQDAAPQIAAFRRGSSLLDRIIEGLCVIARAKPGFWSAVRDEIRSHFERRSELVPRLLFVDQVVSEYCISRSLPIPVQPDALFSAYVSAIEQRIGWLEEIHASESSGAPSNPEAGARVDGQVLEMAALAGAFGVWLGSNPVTLLMERIVLIDTASV